MVTDTLASRLNDTYFTSQSKEGKCNRQKKPQTRTTTLHHGITRKHACPVGWAAVCLSVARMSQSV